MDTANDKLTTIMTQLDSLTPEELKVIIYQKTVQANEYKALTQPKVDFYDQVVVSDGYEEMSSVAKVLNMGFGRNELFALLRERGVLRYNNEPKQQYVDRGYFRLVETKFTFPSGDIGINMKTMVSQKGIEFIRKIILEAQINE